MTIAFIIAIVAGLAATTQASVNTEAGRITKSPYISAAYNFLVSLLALIIITLVMQRNLYIPLAEIAKNPPWIWIGGACGPVVIIMSILCLPVLGSARNMMLACTGQIMAGLVIDQFGLLGSRQIGMTPMRTLGAILVLVGIIAASFSREERSGTDTRSIERRDDHAASNNLDGTDTRSVERRDDHAASNNLDAAGTRASRDAGRTGIFVIMALINGIAAAMQIAANGALNDVVGNAPKTTIVSMCVGFLTICTVMACMSLVKGPDSIFTGDQKAYFVKPNIFMLYGGLCAVVVVGGNAISANVLGTGLVNVMNLAGMMAMSLVIDAIGFLGIAKKPVTVLKVIGMIMIIAGAAFISLSQM